MLYAVCCMLYAVCCMLQYKIIGSKPRHAVSSDYGKETWKEAGEIVKIVEASRVISIHSSLTRNGRAESLGLDLVATLLQVTLGRRVPFRGGRRPSKLPSFIPQEACVARLI